MSFSAATNAAETALLNYSFVLGYTFSKIQEQLHNSYGKMVT